MGKASRAAHEDSTPMCLWLPESLSHQSGPLQTQHFLDPKDTAPRVCGSSRTLASVLEVAGCTKKNTNSESGKLVCSPVFCHQQVKWLLRSHRVSLGLMIFSHEQWRQWPLSSGVVERMHSEPQLSWALAHGLEWSLCLEEPYLTFIFY